MASPRSASSSYEPSTTNNGRSRNMQSPAAMPPVATTPKPLPSTAHTSARCKHPRSSSAAASAAAAPEAPAEMVDAAATAAVGNKQRRDAHAETVRNDVLLCRRPLQAADPANSNKACGATSNSPALPAKRLRLEGPHAAAAAAKEKLHRGGKPCRAAPPWSQQGPDKHLLCSRQPSLPAPTKTLMSTMLLPTVGTMRRAAM
mmetsp:Transcript_27598/g.91639  ORF Transcript_27598/g.91639 Transcript_27598/m.91639 type:complete len:202 (+) Transcript_27598:797-1402(+)